MDNRLESIDSGSNYNFGSKMDVANVRKSGFDLSHVVSTTINNAGELVPLPPIEVCPGDELDIRVRSLLRVMPQVVPLYSRQRMYVHAFYCSYSSLQDDFEVFMTKGYSGNDISQIAPLTSSNLSADVYDSGNGVVTPGSQADYFGLPQGASYADLIAAGISCLPFMAYERIYRDYYLNKNYYIDNRNVLPNVDDYFRVDHTGALLSNTDDDHDKVYFGKLHHRDYPDDYFTSALPFAQRGNAPTLNLDLSQNGLFKFKENLTIGVLNQRNGQPPLADVYLSQGGSIDVTTGEFHSWTTQKPTFSYPEGGVNPLVVMPIHGQGNPVKSGLSYPAEAKQYALDKLSDYFNNALTAGVSAGITLDQIRELAIAQTELEKMARTDGSYAQFGLTFFGKSSKLSHSFKPVYIGGTYQSVSFTEVLQTSASDESSALGEYAGHGIAANNDGYIGHVSVDDYGLIMIIVSIMPDVYYSQGLDKIWTRISQSEFMLPERAKLGLQPIYKRELLFTGTPATDNDLWAYQNPFDDLRYRPNRITGKIADPNSLSFYPYTQARRFDPLSFPVYGQAFARADDVRKDYLFAPSEVAYSAQFSVDIRAVRALPYKPQPAQILN